MTARRSYAIEHHNNRSHTFVAGSDESLRNHIYALLVADRVVATWAMQRRIAKQGFACSTPQVLKECKRMRDEGLIRVSERYSAANSLCWELGE